MRIPPTVARSTRVAGRPYTLKSAWTGQDKTGSGVARPICAQTQEMRSWRGRRVDRRISLQALI